MSLIAGELSDDQLSIRRAIARIVADFGDDYWLERERTGTYPEEFRRAIAAGGWLGICMPVEYGGSGLGVSAAVVMMEAVANSAGAMAAASSIHLNIFGPMPIVKYGTEEQKRRWLPRIISGELLTCFGVTEPDAGLDTTRITTRAVREGDRYAITGRKIWTSGAKEADRVMLLARTAEYDPADPTGGLSLFFAELDPAHVEVREIEKMGRAAVDSNVVFYDGLRVPAADRIGAEGRGFRMILDSFNPERCLIAAEAIGVGRQALARAAAYAREREVFARPIGKNQAIQHPLAACWAELEAAWLMVLRAAALFDAGAPSRDVGAAANAAKYLGAEAGYRACERAILTHGGMGYAREFHVERLFREVWIPRLAPVSQQLVLCHIAERVLGLPKSY